VSQLKEEKPYIYPHKHCIYCGRMIEVSSRNYCLKCKPEYQKEISKLQREKKFQKIMTYYLIAIFTILVIMIIYYSL